MIGLVLWSDSKEKKAVFWCEDHGDLAYYDGNSDARSDVTELNPGDMVDFEVRTDKSVRRAHSAKVVRSDVCRRIQDSVIASSKGELVPPGPADAAAVLEFRRSG